MRRALSAFVLLALLAPSFPVLVIAQEEQGESATVSEEISSPIEAVLEPETPSELEEVPTAPEETPEPLAEESLEVIPESSGTLERIPESVVPTFSGIGQTVGDAVSDHMASGQWYLGQIGIMFPGPGRIHSIVVYPDVDDPDFIDCKDTAYGRSTLNISFGKGSLPMDAMNSRFSAAHRTPREDGGCLYENEEGVYVYPGPSYAFLLNSGYGPTVAFDYLGSSGAVADTLGSAWISNSNVGASSLIWETRSESVASLKYLLSFDQEPPASYATPLPSDYVFPSPDITLEKLSTHTILAEHRNETPIGYGYPFTQVAVNAASYFKEVGTVGYVRAKLSSYHDNAETPLYFRLGTRDCTTPTKLLFEWGIYSGGRNVFGSEVIIGPFSGTECDFTPLDPANPEGTSITIRAMSSGGVFGLGGGDRDGLVDVTVYSNEAATPRVSSVLFLPGIKGSRLYVDEGGNEHQLWEPNGNDDVPELFLDSSGKSIRDGIYTRKNGIIDEIPGSKIYDSLSQMFGRMYDERTINDWESVAYDWRLSLPDLITTGAEREGRIYYGEATSTPYIEQTLTRLAAGSQTGKVTIIAHSNGGLVAKALMQELGDSETARLIDKVIFVGVPQSGAPQALGALLYGYREPLPNLWWLPNYILSQETARSFAENSPMGYHLLPSQAYFDAVHEDWNHPVARFISGYAEEAVAYDGVIGTFNELARYLKAEDGGRLKPSVSDLDTANVLRSNLIAYAQETHNELDSWTPPSEVQLYQIAGWGADTISGVEFYEECGRSGCKEKYRPLFVEDGDGVVPVPSALLVPDLGNVENYWINLQKYNALPLPVSSKGHGNLFEIEGLRDMLEGLVENGAEVSSSISQISPIGTDPSKKLRFILHSPLTLELIDSLGNHLSSEQNEIVGAVYGEFGEVKYILAPAGQEYTLLMNGTDTGTFSLDIQEVVSDEVISTATIADVPVTEETTATLTIVNGTEDASPLTVDLNGDAEIDFEIIPEQNQTVVYVEAVAESSNNGNSTGQSKRRENSTEAPETTYEVLPNVEADFQGQVLGESTSNELTGSTIPQETGASASTTTSSQPLTLIPEDQKSFSETLYTFIKWLLSLIGISL